MARGRDEGADPALLAHLEGYRDRASRLLPRAIQPGIELKAAAGAPTRFSLGAWRLRLAGEPREVERPPQIADDLQQRTPQAILRDLHRPVRLIPPIRLQTAASGVDPGRAAARSRAAMRARYTIRMHDQPNPRAMVADDWSALRAVLAAPWEHARPERRGGEASLEPGPEDAYWFGRFGGVDPDQ